MHYKTHLKRPIVYIFVISLTILGALEFSWATWWPAVFGPEFEFSNETLDAIDHVHGSNGKLQEGAAARKLADYIRQTICPQYDCRAEQVRGKWGKEWRFYLKWHKNGSERTTYVQISWDPKVVEVLMEPMSVIEIRDAEHIIQSFLFDSVKQVGLSPSYDHSGHINLGASLFQNDPDLFLRFYVDHANHPEWDLGVLGLDPHNAPPLSILPYKQSKALIQIIQEFQNGKHQNIDELAKQIQNRVHSSTSTWNAIGGSGHYQALSIKTIAGIKWGPFYLNKPQSPERQRLELRGSYGQTSYAQFVRYTEFIEARIRLLARERADGVPIKYNPSGRRNFTKDEMVSLFHKELDRMGLDRKKYRILMHPRIRPSYYSGKCSDLYSI